LLEGIYVGIYISKVLNCKNFLGPHYLNTLQARVIDMKLYCDDVMGGSDDPPGPEPVLPQPLVQKSFYNLQNSFFPTKFPCHPNGGKNQETSGKFEANVS
jgi:hypothetical protein